MTLPSSKQASHLQTHCQALEDRVDAEPCKQQGRRHPDAPQEALRCGLTVAVASASGWHACLLCIPPAANGSRAAFMCCAVSQLGVRCATFNLCTDPEPVNYGVQGPSACTIMPGLSACTIMPGWGCPQGLRNRAECHLLCAMHCSTYVPHVKLAEFASNSLMIS